MRRDHAQKFAHRRCDVRLHGLCLQPRNSLCHTAHGAGPRGVAGVAALAFGREHHVHHALFANAYHRKRLRYAGEHAVHHGAALVHHKGGLHALLL